MELHGITRYTSISDMIYIYIYSLLCTNTHRHTSIIFSFALLPSLFAFSSWNSGPFSKLCPTMDTDLLETRQWKPWKQQKSRHC